jgi:hypothetical protein
MNYLSAEYRFEINSIIISIFKLDSFLRTGHLRYILCSKNKLVKKIISINMYLPQEEDPLLERNRGGGLCWGSWRRQIPFQT